MGAMLAASRAQSRPAAELLLQEDLDLWAVGPVGPIPCLQRMRPHRRAYRLRQANLRTHSAPYGSRVRRNPDAPRRESRRSRGRIRVAAHARQPDEARAPAQAQTSATQDPDARF
jgi:hypothetical protein